MDVNNYNVNFRTFRNNFQNISNYIPSDICKDMLLEINIKLILSNIKKEQFIACLFNKNNISNNYIATLPLLNDCCEDIIDLKNINCKCFQTIDEYIKIIKNIKNIIKK